MKIPFACNQVLSFVFLLVAAATPGTLSAADNKASATKPAQHIHLRKRVTPDKPSHARVTDAVHKDVIVIKFREDLKIRLRGGIIVSLDNTDISAFREVLKSRPNLRVRRLFDRPEDQLDAEKKRGEARTREQLADLNLYFVINTPTNMDTASTEALIDALNALDIVEIAYPEPIAEPAAADIPPTTPDFEPNQGYLNSAPQGVDARYAWGFPGGRGEGTKFIDVENNWRLTHEDFKAPFYSNVNPTSLADKEHGTAVLGIIVGEANGFGVTGIAPEADYGVMEAGGNIFIPSAINIAASQLAAGDVILIELHQPGPTTGVSCTCGSCPSGGTFGYVPMEYTQGIFDAIKTATANGIIVVEAGGNGSVVLDSPIYQGRFDRNVRDSGAILVGASPGGSNTPACFSNSGSRFDLRGWGSGVATTGYGSMFNGDPGVPDPNQYYTATFSGTSSASPIVVGSVLSVQGYYRQLRGMHLPLEQMLQILKMEGTPQAASTNHIGPLPNIRAVIDRIPSDYDLDGLLNTDETVYGTDPYAIDTDGDGYSDYNEICYDGNCSNLSPNDLDPTNPDTDDDGINDGDEIKVYGTNPRATDTDGDGLSDYAEIVTYNTDPNKTDTDDDGLSDSDEINIYSTDPTTSDTDLDGMSDDWELAYGTNAVVDDARGDLDGDGVVNVIEFLRGTVPNDPNSKPLLQTWYVDQSNQSGVENGTQSSPYSSVANAMSAASEGDTISLASDTYSVGNLSGTFNLRFVGQSDQNTVLQVNLYLSSSRWLEFENLSLVSGYSVLFNARGIAIKNCRVAPTFNFNNQSKIQFSNVLYRSDTPGGTGLNLYSLSEVEFVNSTIADFAFGIRAESGTKATLRNTILANTDDLDGVTDGSGISYSLISNGDFAGERGNLAGNPAFVGVGNYHLLPSSPAIDSGDPADDFSLEPMNNGGRINMGRYGNTPEATVGTDTDGDGLTDQNERCYDGDCGTYNPYNPSTNPNGQDLDYTIVDTDDDGFTDGAEYAGGSDPLNASSIFTITSVPGNTAGLGASYSYQVASSWSTAAYALISGPSGMSITPAGYLSWMPSSGQIGTHTVTVSASAAGYTATQTFNVTVIIANNGDINDDGNVDAEDLILAKRIMLGEIVPTPGQIERGDMFSDGVINVSDYILIQKKVLGF